MLKIGFIDYYLDEWHANNYPAWIKEQSGGEMEVAYAYGHIDSPIGGMTTNAWCEKYGIQRCATIEELIEKSDPADRAVPGQLRDARGAVPAADVERQADLCGQNLCAGLSCGQTDF